MSLISSIEEFKYKYSSNMDFITTNNFTEDVLEYYFNNFKILGYNSYGVQMNDNNLEYASISRYQILSDVFINKYADRLIWVDLFKNTNIKLSYDIIVKNIYHFNLYEVYINISDNESYVLILDRIINKYRSKLSIDRIHYEFNFK